MSLVPGSRFGPYEVVSQVGAGGMGEVYCARDARLGRDVALKILPVSFAGDPDRMARFQREAQVLASLNHPNIASIYGLEEGAIVMELVEGPTLADRLTAGPLLLTEALAIARQIAEALEAAHEKGIVHRDLKPANVKITPDGVVKVLDFGLAKLADDPAGSPANSAHSPTLTMRGTQAGVIMGSAHYMSPEQASGKPVDKRADIWAFGVVLMEMLSGRVMFDGETVSHTLAAVLTKDLDWGLLPASTPRPIAELLRRCLDRNIKTRLRDIGEARIAIERYAADPLPAPAQDTPAPAPRRLWPILAAVFAIAAIVLGVSLWRARQRLPQPFLQFDSVASVQISRGAGFSLAISPDGSRIVLAGAEEKGKRQLFTRLISNPAFTPLSETADAISPFFSPDGQSIGFFSGEQLKRISVLGGPATTICAAPSGRGGTWTEDGRIIFAPDTRSQLFQVGENGGTPGPVTVFEKENGEVNHRWPRLIPGTDLLLFVAHNTGGSYEKANIVVQSLKTGKRKIVVRGGTHPHYLTGGYLLWFNKVQLLAAPFDTKSLAITGAMVPMLQDVSNSNSGASQFAVSGTGLAIYAPGQASNSQLGWLEPGGKVEPAGEGGSELTQVKIAPDGKRAVLTIHRENAASLFIHDFERGTRTRLTAETRGWQLDPVWTPTGKHLVYSSSNGGFEGGRQIDWVRADGASQPVTISEWPDGIFPKSFSPDGRRLLVVYHAQRKNLIGMIPLDLTDPDRPKAGKLEPFLSEPTRAHNAVLSPDGLWIAYDVGAAPSEIFVRPYPGPGGKWLVSKGDGIAPFWSRDGRRLFYYSGGTSGRAGIHVVDYAISGGTFVPGKPQLWAPAESIRFHNGIGTPIVDLAPDSKRFLASYFMDAGPGSATSLRALVNLQDEVRRRIGSGGN
ncbi:MAG TPA: protein kinase [Bryobacteraceae bacterium]|nr:protein kinase [Bryobacteraceae bacterium]